MEAQRFSVGTILVRTAGDYSSYGLCGLYRVIKDLDTRETRAAYKAAVGRRTKPDYDGWLILQGYLEPLDYIEWHEGD